MSYPTDPPHLTANTTHESASEILDGSVFRDLVESLQQPTTVAAVYRKFVENAAAFIDELRVQDTAARIDTLHTLKGSAAMMGASRMAELAGHLQAQGASVQVEQAIEELAAELTRLRQAAAGQLQVLGVSLDVPE